MPGLQGTATLLGRLGWILVTCLALGVASYAIAVLCVPDFRPAFLRERFSRMPLAAFAHLSGGAVSLAVGPFQLSSRLRARHLTLHRFIGLIYLGSVIIGSVGGFALASVAQGGTGAQMGFALLALLWLWSSFQAYHAATGGRPQHEHQRWALRSYALTFAAVTLRIYIPLFRIGGVPFEAAYVATAWLSWVPNFLVAELIARATRTVGRPDSWNGPTSGMRLT